MRSCEFVPRPRLRSLIVNVSPTINLSNEGFAMWKADAMSASEIPARRSSAAAVCSHCSTALRSVASCRLSSLTRFAWRAGRACQPPQDAARLLRSRQLAAGQLSRISLMKLLSRLTTSHGLHSLGPIHARPLREPLCVLPVDQRRVLLVTGFVLLPFQLRRSSVQTFLVRCEKAAAPQCIVPYLRRDGPRTCRLTPGFQAANRGPCRCRPRRPE